MQARAFKLVSEDLKVIDQDELKEQAHAAWQRVEDELKRRGKNPSWLAQRLGFAQVQRVYNWKYRGLPTDAYRMVAEVFGKSLDWVAGVAEDEDGEAPDLSQLSPMAVKLALEFNRIKDEEARLGAFAHCIGVIARASGGPSPPPTTLPG